MNNFEQRAGAVAATKNGPAPQHCHLLRIRDFQIGITVDMYLYHPVDIIRIYRRLQ